MITSFFQEYPVRRKPFFPENEQCTIKITTKTLFIEPFPAFWGDKKTGKVYPKTCIATLSQPPHPLKYVGINT
jgi:hypothetical protein